MNEVMRHARRTATQAAEGLPRWRWTVAEIERIAQLGAFADEDRFELIGGEIVPMSPKGRQHEILRGILAFYLTRHAPEGTFVVSEPQLNLTDDTYVLPDILVHPTAIKTPDVRGPTALLVIEIADSSLGYDLNVKAPLYLKAGVREYWVINALTRETTVHSSAMPDAPVVVPSDAPLTPALVAGLSVRLADLDLD